MKAQCIHCLKIYNPPEENRGKQVFCPKCHQTFIIVPYIEPIDAVPEKTIDTQPRPTPAANQLNTRKRRAAKKRAKKPDKTRRSRAPVDVADTDKGIRRLWFSILIIPIVAGAAALLTLTLQGKLYIPTLGKNTVDLLSYLGSSVLLIIALLLIASRLRNIGNSGWWTLMMFVHPVHIILAIKCFVCPQGYRYNKKLDRPGKFWLWIFIILITAAIVSGVLFFLKEQGWLFAKKAK